MITDYLNQGIEAGAVSDRATMVSALQRAGLEVPRQGKDYTSRRRTPRVAANGGWKERSMNGTSSVSDLQSRLQKRAEQDRKEIEALDDSSSSADGYPPAVRSEMPHKLVFPPNPAL